MPLSPIQMFQNNGSNSIEGLLRAGPEAISNIMNQAIQIGRSMSDKQLAQERDLFAMRDRETQLAQRRAENLESNNKDALRFGRAVFESDRRYATEFGNTSFEKSRLTANDAFNQNIDERRMNLSEKKYADDQALVEEERQRRISAEEALRAKYDPDTPLPAEDSSSLPMIDNPEIVANEKLKRDETNMVGARSLFGVKDEAADTRSKNIINDVTDQNPRLPEQIPAPSDIFALAPGAPPEEKAPAAPATDSEDLVGVRVRMAKIKEDLKNDALTGAARDNAMMMLEQSRIEEDSLSKAATAKTPEEAKSLTAAAEKARMTGFLMNENAFQPQSKFVGKTTTEDEAAAYDKDKMKSELNSAINAGSPEKYVELGGKNLSAADKEIRRKFYQYALKTGRDEGGSTTTPSAPTSNNPGFNPTYD